MSATASSSWAEQYDNAGYAQERLEETKEQERREQVEAVENLSTKRWLEDKLEEQARTVPVMGRDFRFTPIGNAKVEEVLRLASEEAAQLDADDVNDIEDVDEEHLDDMPEFVKAMRETLEEHILDDYMAERGLKKLPLEVLQMVFEDVAMDEGLSESEGNER